MAGICKGTWVSFFHLSRREEEPQSIPLSETEISRFILQHLELLREEASLLEERQLCWIRREIIKISPRLSSEALSQVQALLSSVVPSAEKPPPLYPGLKQLMEKELMIGLERWEADPTATGDKMEASKRILEAFSFEKGHLSLVGLGLNMLPPEIGCLDQLSRLWLQSNGLRHLPPEIGELSKLEALHLAHNEIRELPKEIGRLRHMKWFYADENQLERLPREMGNLMELRLLNLNRNRLTQLPSSMGALLELRELYLGSNRLESLPTELGGLVNLCRLDFQNNPNLRELPISFGNLSKIFYLANVNTSVPESQIGGILSSSRVKQRTAALHALPRRIALWKRRAQAYSEETPLRNLDFLDDLELTEKISINDWLARLERAEDFRRTQGALARVVCDLLASLNAHPNFKELFFSQVNANLESCQDRAAMALNELYTCWRLESMDKESSLREKLRLISQLAKTFTLRNEIARRIEARGELQRESVEIFLYYESTLKDSLGLLSAIDHMSYPSIGKKKWIKASELVTAVEGAYLEWMLDSPLVQKLAESDPSFHSPTIPFDQTDPCPMHLHEDLEQLERHLEEGLISEQDYLLGSKRLMRLNAQFGGSKVKLQEAERKARLEWICKQLMIEPA